MAAALEESLERQEQKYAYKVKMYEEILCCKCNPQTQGETVRRMFDTLLIDFRKIKGINSSADYDEYYRKDGIRPPLEVPLRYLEVPEVPDGPPPPPPLPGLKPADSWSDYGIPWYDRSPFTDISKHDKLEVEKWFRSVTGIDPKKQMAKIDEMDVDEEEEDASSAFKPRRKSGRKTSKARKSARKTPRRKSARKTPRRKSARKTPRRKSARKTPRRKSARKSGSKRQFLL
jgi:hypothetical protein